VLFRGRMTRCVVGRTSVSLPGRSAPVVIAHKCCGSCRWLQSGGGGGIQLPASCNTRGKDGSAKERKVQSQRTRAQQAFL
jgi:hypothetical protein